MVLPKLDGNRVQTPAPVVAQKPIPPGDDALLGNVVNLLQEVKTALPWLSSVSGAEGNKLFKTAKAPELPQFDLNNKSHQALAKEIQGFVKDCDFHAAYSRFIADDPYRPVFDRYDAHWTSLSESKSDQALAFFTLGKSLNGKQLKTLFAGHEGLLGRLVAYGLVVFDGNKVRLNDMSLLSHRLPNGETMILFSDLPDHMHIGGRPAKAEVSGTSLFTLGLQEADYQRGERHHGTIADFGSGNGIQAIAQLKMNPLVTRAYCLEIEPSAMNYNRLNALLNGVGDRVVILDNTDTKALARALDGKPLDFAVSNPPFNTVPHELEKAFDGFGYGGDHGIDITKIFLDQALPLMAPGAKFEFYSQLAVHKNAERVAAGYFLTDALKNLDGPRVEYALLTHLDDAAYGMTADVYADSLSRYLNRRREETGHGDYVSAARINALLDRDDVGSVRPAKVTITGPVKTGLASLAAPKVTFHMTTSDDLADGGVSYEKRQAPPTRPGGVFEETQPLSIHPGGGAFIQSKSYGGSVGGGERIESRFSSGGERFELGGALLHKMDMNDPILRKALKRLHDHEKKAGKKID